MKYVVLVFVFLIFGFTAFSQKGVNFQAITFKEALAKAQAENKLIFMDCYTAWCGPCKRMANYVFPQEKAGEYFNSKFICVKFDLEKGEGPELWKQFQVKAYPTFLMIRPDGSVQHKIVGGYELEDFIENVEKGLSKKSSLDYLNKMYAKGKMSKKQMIEYKKVLKVAYEREMSWKIGNELDTSLSDKEKMRKEYWPILQGYVYGTDNFDLVLNHVEVFNKNVGKEKVEKYLFEKFGAAISNAYTRRNTREPLVVLDRIQKELANVNFLEKEMLEEKLIMCRAHLEGDVDKLIAIAESIASSENQKIFFILNIFVVLQKKATEEQVKRFLQLESKFLNLVKGEDKETVKGYFQKYRNQR